MRIWRRLGNVMRTIGVKVGFLSWLRFWTAVARWALAYMRLYFRAALVWGCWPDRSLRGPDRMRDFEEQIHGTPLWAELARLEAEMERLERMAAGHPA